MAKKTKFVLPYAPQRLLTEQFKGEVEQNIVKFPKDLGEEHPFSFKLMEDSYKKFGFATAAIDKHIDFIVSPGFFVTSDDKKAETIINDFIKKVGFDHVLRTWIKEALIKGNGFLEIGMSKNEVQLKVINANNMYVERNKRGEITSYNQFTGAFNKFDVKKVIPFLPPEIAHLKINSVGDDAYAMGMLFPALLTLDNLFKSDKDMHILIGRKANAPIHAKLGSPEEPATQADVDALGVKLEYLNNLHEWATDHKVEFNVIEFGKLAENFTAVLEHDIQMLFYIFQIPAVLMGMAKIPEGLAEVQMDTYERRIVSLQEIIEKVVEEDIFRPILNLNGLDSDVEMHWGQPSEDSVNERIDKLSGILKLMTLSPQMRALIEIDLANNLGFEGADKILVKPDEAEEVEREREEDIEQPEVPGEKEEKTEVRLEESMKLNEWLNFDYQQYRREVLAFIRKDKFEDLLGRDSRDFSLGKLTTTEVNKVRNILLDGFENDKSIKEMSDEMAEIGLKDRISINEEGRKTITMRKEIRPITIARTESTRVAAEGVLVNYNKKDVENVVWLASVSERTCPLCLENNGKIFNLKEASGMIPLHVSCRCTWLPLTE